MDSQDHRLNKLCVDQAGLTSIKQLYKEATATDKSVTLKIVRGLHNKIGAKTKHSGHKNSFVAPNAKYEYQID